MGSIAGSLEVAEPVRRVLAATALAFAFGVQAQSPPAPGPALPVSAVLFENVRVFDGRSERLSGPQNVLVVGNTIESMSATEVTPPADAQLTRVDGGGRTLMPGLIDAHTHMAMSVLPLPVLLTADPNYTQIVQARAAGEMLLRGFTSARDLSGPTFGLKRAIDEVRIPGPRIWPSGAAISQTSGHADYRSHFDLPRVPGTPAHFSERYGYSVIADSPDEVRRGVREQLLRGASHIKLMAGGGVSSPSDPLDVTQYSEAEIRAAVEAAENWGTYVTVHAYTPRAIEQAIRAGVRCIEHGQLADEASAKLMAERGIWWSLQPFLEDEDTTPFPEGSANRAKQRQMTSGTDRAYELARQYKVRTAFGTDTLFDARIASRQGAQLTKLVRWYTPAEVLKMATGDNGELLALSGLRSPYPGKLGVVEAGALADLLLVDGDPLADIKLIEDPAKNFVVIMKDGRLYKNLLR